MLCFIVKLLTLGMAICNYWQLANRHDLYNADTFSPFYEA